MNKERQANLELLRILSMLFIITLHILGHGGVLGVITPDTVQFYFYWFIEALAIVAVNCYVLISGYFLIETKFKLKKLITLWGQVVFYSIVIYVLLICTRQITFSIKDLLVSVFPVLTVQYWFVSMYIGMYTLSPLLNIAIKAMNQREHLICLIVISTLFSVWATICPFSSTLNFGDGMGIVWFIVLYLVAAYLRLYYKPNYKPKMYLKMYLIGAGLIACSKYSFSIAYVFTGLDVLMQGSSIFYNYNSILVYFTSVALFIAFLNLRIKGERYINLILKLSPLTFAIYLIHEQKFMRNVLWSYVNATAYIDKRYFPFFMLGTVAGIYIVCSVIEKLRIIVFKKVNISAWLEEKIIHIQMKLSRVINNLITK